MMNSVKTFSSSVSLNGSVPNVGSVLERLNLSADETLPIACLRNGLVAAQGKSSSCELLVVFDARVSDLPTLLGAVVEGAGCYVLSEDEDAIAVVTRLLADTGARRLALVAHGEPGVVYLGTQPLDLAQVKARAGLLQEWSVEEIALYSCEVGQSEAFISALERWTGARVAAAITKVGAVALGGSWDLKIALEAVSVQPPFKVDAISAYKNTLAIAINLNNAAGFGTTSFTEQTPVTLFSSATFSANNVVTSDNNSVDQITVTLPNATPTEILSLTATAQSIATANGITFAYNSSTGVLTLNGLNKTNIVWQNILRGIQYNNTSDTPATASRNIAVTAINTNGGTGTDNQILSITAVNDSAIIGTPSNSAVTEDLNITSGNLNATGTISISDVDSPETFNTTVTSASGNLGTLTLAANGNYTYSVDNNVVQSLGAGQVKTETFTISSADGTTKNIIFTINGVNDSAIIGDPTVSDVTEDLSVNGSGNLTAIGSISVNDVDQGQTTFNTMVNSASGNLGTLILDASGSYSYSVANSAVQYLGEGSTKTETFTISSVDGTTKNIIFTITGTNDEALLSSDVVTLAETDAPLIANGTLTISDVDSPATFVAQTATLGDNGTFSINPSGAWTYTANEAFDSLNIDDSITDTFTVESADGTSTTVQVTIIGTNDTPIVTAETNSVNEDATVSGSVSGTDVDTGETATLVYGLIGTAPTGLTFNPDGTYFFDAASYDFLAQGQTQILTIPFTATDVNGAVSASENLVITISGTNDTPVVTAAANSVNEDAIITGSVSGTDVDTGETATLSYALVDTPPTGLTFNADGTYSFDASSYDSLPQGQIETLTIPFTATDVNDAVSTTADLVITIIGINDAAILSFAVVTLEETNSVLTTGGTLTITDVDSPATFVAQTGTTGTNGIFSIDTAGVWTYTANSAFDSLNVGDSVTDSFTVTSADGTSTTVQVTINGTNDAALLSSAVVSLAEADAALTTGGTLTITDVDSPATFVAQTGTTGTNGIFSIDTAGVWTYTANSAFDSLNVGDSVTDSFTVTSADGTSTTVQVTINGTNDAAVITGTSTGSVLESGTNVSGTPIATDDLNATDIDNPTDTWTAVATATNSVNGYGTYTLSASGLWTYTLNNTNSVVQALNTGDTLTDTFVVQTIDGTSQTVSVTINGANDAPIITSFSDDTGASTTDRITRDNTLTLTGIAEANSNIQLFNGLTVLGTATTNSLGNWSLTTAPLSDATYNLTATATDSAGNVSASSAPLSVTVDTTAVAPTLSLATDSGSSSTDRITNSGVVNVSGLEPGASWQYSINNGTTWLTGSGNSFTLTGDGNKSVIVRQTDIAGNASGNSAPFTFTLDTTPSTKTATVTSMTPDTGTSATDYLTNDGSGGRTYSGTLSEALLAGESIQVSVDGGATWANATVIGTTWSFTDNVAKTSNWIIQTRVLDVAGNPGNINSRAVTLDQQISAASAVTLDLLATSDTGTSSTDNITTIVRPTFAVTFDSAKAQVGDILEIRQGSSVLGTVTLNTTQVSNGTANITLTTNLTTGTTNTLSAVHRDAAGNSITGSSTLAVTLDQQISAASAVTLDLLATSDSGSSSIDNLTNISTPTFAVTFNSANASVGDVIEIRRGTTVLGATTLTTVGTGSVNVTLTTPLTNGLNNLSTVHRDAAGNSVTGATTLAVTLDTVAPAVANVVGYTSSSIVGTTEANANVLLSTNASAPTTFAATTTANASGNYTVNTSILGGSNTGTSYYVYAQDVAGNLSTASSAQRIIVGTSGVDTLANVGSASGDLLFGGLDTDSAQYAVASNAIALTGQVTSASITAGSINIRAANIDVLTGIETLQFTGSGYTGLGTGTNQLRSTVQTALSNNSIAALAGAYNAATGIFTLGSSPSNNATLVAFDSNTGTATNYETFLVLDQTSILGSLSATATGTVTLGL